MIRTVDVKELTANIREMCIEAVHFLTPDMREALEKAVKKEESPLGRQILCQLQENLDIAGDEMIPICQDTGMAVVFLEIGQDVHFEGGSVEEAVNEGVRLGYTEGFLRKSVVKDPLIRENTKDNTPAVLYCDIVPGDRVKITVAPKGFGSENMSRIFMLKPADGIEGVKKAILSAVSEAGPNACPPLVVGVGIGGTFEKCALMAKKALTRSVNHRSEIPYVRELEEEMLEKINRLGIGPGGLGGTVHSTRRQHQHVSDAYCGAAGSGQYVLPRQQTQCADNISKIRRKNHGAPYYTTNVTGRRQKLTQRRLCLSYGNALHRERRSSQKNGGGAGERRGASDPREK